jgi:endonuclease/exonuclease/phosphatase family metal-dependent hydrolase
MRIVTWNMDFKRPKEVRDAAWDFLLTELQPDIALVQEAKVPDNTGYEVLPTRALKPGSTEELSWGSAILSRVGKPETKVALSFEDISARGAVQIASCTIAGLGEVCIVNIHSRLDYNEKQKVISNLRKTFEVVLRVLDGCDRFIVGGDLNTARSLDAAYGAEYGHGEFWEGIDAGILKEALPGGEERQSYWGHGDDNKGPTGNTLQDDHVFLDAETFQLVSESRVWDTPQVRRFSDHGPIVVDLTLPSNPGEEA